MSRSALAGNSPTFLTLALEIRCIIYKEVFAGARIVLPATKGRRRSRRLHNKLLSLLQVCRQCHLEAFPILYSNAVMEMGAKVAAATIDQGLQKQYFQNVKSLIVDSSALKRTRRGPRQTHFPVLKKLTVRTRDVCEVPESQDVNVIHQSCRSTEQGLRRSEAGSWINWSSSRDFTIHITFKVCWQTRSHRHKVGPSSFHIRGMD